VWFSGWGETTIEIVNRVGSALYGPVLAVFLLAWRSRRADGRSAVAGAFAGLACNLALARFVPGVSWLWWNVFGCAVALGVGWALGRAAAEPEPHRVPDTRGLATVLVAYFVLILLVLLGVTLAV
jgi:SSS family solute:Na+ symporter